MLNILQFLIIVIFSEWNICTYLCTTYNFMFLCFSPENGSIGYSSVSFSTGKYIGSWSEHQRVSRWEIFKKSIIFYSNNKTSILLVQLPDRILNVSNATPDPNENFRCDPKIEFPCNGTDTCILKSWICDGRVSTF